MLGFRYLIRIKRDNFDGRVSEKEPEGSGKDRTPGRCVDGIRFPYGPRRTQSQTLSLPPPTVVRGPI